MNDPEPTQSLSAHEANQEPLQELLLPLEEEQLKEITGGAPQRSDTMSLKPHGSSSREYTTFGTTNQRVWIEGMYKDGRQQEVLTFLHYPSSADMDTGIQRYNGPKLKKD